MKRLFFVILFFNRLFVPIDAHIYDCFLFYNELELLEVRLNELNDYVDYFVLVESSETFRGNLKPYYFEENKHLFQNFLHKIIYVKVENRIETNNAWVRENYQRNQIMRGLVNCQPDDLILISDADEIVRPSAIVNIKSMLDALSIQEPYKIILCNQHMYRYYMNRFDNRDFPWPGSIGLYYKELMKYSPDFCRQLGQYKRIPALNNAGWHFTYMGGHARVVDKLAAFSHAECDTPHNRELKTIQQKAASFQLVPIDNTYPLFIQQHQQEYCEKGFIDQKK